MTPTKPSTWLRCCASVPATRLNRSHCASSPKTSINRLTTVSWTNAPEPVRPQHLMRLRAILDDAEPSLVLTDSTLIEALRPACERSSGESPQLLAVDQVPRALALQWQSPTLHDHDIA